MSSQTPRPLHDKSPFARNLSAALTASGETSEHFARRIDVTLRTVQRWRAGEGFPKSNEVVKVAAALGMTVETLFADSGNGSDHPAAA